MDDLDLYDDLDEFQEQQEKKSKELQDVEDKYQESLKTIQSLEDENKSLRKKIQRIELSFQSLLDTARTEIKRKDKEIERLRKEKDDICFRRKIPNRGQEAESKTFVHNPFASASITEQRHSVKGNFVSALENEPQNQAEHKETRCKDDLANLENPQHSEDTNRANHKKRRRSEETEENRGHKKDHFNGRPERDNDKYRHEKRDDRNRNRSRYDRDRYDGGKYDDRKTTNISESSERCEYRRSRTERDHRYKDSRQRNRSSERRDRHKERHDNVQRKDYSMKSSDQTDNNNRDSCQLMSKGAELHSAFEISNSVGKEFTSLHKELMRVESSPSQHTSKSYKVPALFKEILSSSDTEDPFQTTRKVNKVNESIKKTGSVGRMAVEYTIEKLSPECKNSSNVNFAQINTDAINQNMEEHIRDNNKSPVLSKEKLLSPSTKDTRLPFEAMKKSNKVNKGAKKTETVSDECKMSATASFSQRNTDTRNNDKQELEYENLNVNSGNESTNLQDNTSENIEDLLYENLDDIAVLQKETAIKYKDYLQVSCQNAFKMGTPRKIELFDALFGSSPNCGNNSDSSTPKSLVNNIKDILANTSGTRNSTTTSPGDYSDCVLVETSSNECNEMTQQNCDKDEFDNWFIANEDRPLANGTTIDLTEDLLDNEIESNVAGVIVNENTMKAKNKIQIKDKSSNNTDEDNKVSRKMSSQKNLAMKKMQETVLQKEPKERSDLFLKEKNGEQYLPAPSKGVHGSKPPTSLIKDMDSTTSSDNVCRSKMMNECLKLSGESENEATTLSTANVNIPGLDLISSEVVCTSKEFLNVTGLPTENSPSKEEKLSVENSPLIKAKPVNGLSSSSENVSQPQKLTERLKVSGVSENRPVLRVDITTTASVNIQGLHEITSEAVGISEEFVNNTVLPKENSPTKEKDVEDLLFSLHKENLSENTKQMDPISASLNPANPIVRLDTTSSEKFDNSLNECLSQKHLKSNATRITSNTEMVGNLDEEHTASIVSNVGIDISEDLSLCQSAKLCETNNSSNELLSPKSIKSRESNETNSSTNESSTSKNTLETENIIQNAAQVVSENSILCQNDKRGKFSSTEPSFISQETKNITDVDPNNLELQNKREQEKNIYASETNLKATEQKDSCIVSTESKLTKSIHFKESSNMVKISSEVQIGTATTAALENTYKELENIKDSSFEIPSVTSKLPDSSLMTTIASTSTEYTGSESGQISKKQSSPETLTTFASRSLLPPASYLSPDISSESIPSENHADLLSSPKKVTPVSYMDLTSPDLHKSPKSMDSKIKTVSTMDVQMKTNKSPELNDSSLVSTDKISEQIANVLRNNDEPKSRYESAVSHKTRLGDTSPKNICSLEVIEIADDDNDSDNNEKGVEDKSENLEKAETNKNMSCEMGEKQENLRYSPRVCNVSSVPVPTENLSHELKASQITKSNKTGEISESNMIEEKHDHLNSKSSAIKRIEKDEANITISEIIEIENDVESENENMEKKSTNGSFDIRITDQDLMEISDEEDTNGNQNKAGNIFSQDTILVSSKSVCSENSVKENNQDKNITAAKSKNIELEDHILNENNDAINNISNKDAFETNTPPESTDNTNSKVAKVCGISGEKIQKENRCRDVPTTKLSNREKNNNGLVDACSENQAEKTQDNVEESVVSALNKSDEKLNVECGLNVELKQTNDNDELSGNASPPSIGNEEISSASKHLVENDCSKVFENSKTNLIFEKSEFVNSKSFDIPSSKSSSKNDNETVLKLISKNDLSNVKDLCEKLQNCNDSPQNLKTTTIKDQSSVTQIPTRAKTTLLSENLNGSSCGTTQRDSLACDHSNRSVVLNVDKERLCSNLGKEDTKSTKSLENSEKLPSSNFVTSKSQSESSSNNRENSGDHKESASGIKTKAVNDGNVPKDKSDVQVQNSESCTKKEVPKESLQLEASVGKDHQDLQILSHEILQPICILENLSQSKTAADNFENNEKILTVTENSKCKEKTEISSKYNVTPKDQQHVVQKNKETAVSSITLLVSPLKSKDWIQRRIIINPNIDSSSSLNSSKVPDNIAKDSLNTLESNTLSDCYNSPTILPSISTNCPTPSNFSGIFSKKALSTDLLKSRKKSPKLKDCILPAASVLCSKETFLKNATKSSESAVNKKLHWELLRNKDQTSEIEDDTDAESSDDNRQTSEKPRKCIENEDKGIQKQEEYSTITTPPKDLRCLETLNKSASESEETKLQNLSIKVMTKKKKSAISRRNAIDKVPIKHAVSYFKQLEELENFKNLTITGNKCTTTPSTSNALKSTPSAAVPGKVIKYRPQKPRISRKIRTKLMASSRIRVKSVKSLMEASLYKAAVIKRKSLCICLHSKARRCEGPANLATRCRKSKNSNAQLRNIGSKHSKQLCRMSRLQINQPCAVDDKVNRELVQGNELNLQGIEHNDANVTKEGTDDVDHPEMLFKSINSCSTVIEGSLIQTEKSINHRGESPLISCENTPPSHAVVGKVNNASNEITTGESTPHNEKKISADLKDTARFKTPTKNESNTKLTTKGDSKVDKTIIVPLLASPLKEGGNANTSIIYHKEHSSDEHNSSLAENSEPECNKYLKEDDLPTQATTDGRQLKVATEVDQIEKAEEQSAKDKEVSIKSVVTLPPVDALIQPNKSFIKNYKIPKLTNISNDNLTKSDNKKKSVSMEEIGLNVPPFKCHLSSFRIPKINANASDNPKTKSWMVKRYTNNAEQVHEEKGKDVKEELTREPSEQKELKSKEKSRKPNLKLKDNTANISLESNVENHATFSEEKRKKPNIKERRKSITITRSNDSTGFNNKSLTTSTSMAEPTKLASRKDDNNALKTRKKSSHTLRKNGDYSSDDNVDEVTTSQRKSVTTCKTSPAVAKPDSCTKIRRKSINIKRRAAILSSSDDEECLIKNSEKDFLPPRNEIKDENVNSDHSKILPCKKANGKKMQSKKGEENPSEVTEEDDVYSQYVKARSEYLRLQKQLLDSNLEDISQTTTCDIEGQLSLSGNGNNISEISEKKQQKDCVNSLNSVDISKKCINSLQNQTSPEKKEHVKCGKGKCEPNNSATKGGDLEKSDHSKNTSKNIANKSKSVLTDKKTSTEEINTTPMIVVESLKLKRNRRKSVYLEKNTTSSTENENSLTNDRNNIGNKDETSKQTANNPKIPLKERRKSLCVDKANQMLLSTKAIYEENKMNGIVTDSNTYINNDKKNKNNNSSSKSSTGLFEGNAKEVVPQESANNSKSTRTLRTRSKSIYVEKSIYDADKSEDNHKSSEKITSEPTATLHEHILNQNTGDHSKESTIRNSGINKMRRKSLNLQRRILDSSEDETTDLANTSPKTVIPPNKDIANPLNVNVKRSPPRKRRKVKVLSSSYEKSDTPNNFKSNVEDLTNMPLASPTFNHPIFHTQVRDEPLPNINNFSHDDRFNEIDSTMQDMFRSPQREFEVNSQPAVVAPDSMLTIITEPLNDSKSNVTIDETVCTNQADERSSLDITASTDSTVSHIQNESKHLSLGSSEYRFEKVSENVVNLFISRKRKRKRTT